MPSTVIRSASKTGLVLLESRVSVANDGLVTIGSRFLAPASGLTASDFQIDSSWPPGFVLPPSTPVLQGGPYLLNKNVSKQNGLTVVDAEYISATNPPRLAFSESVEKLTFSGYAERIRNGESISGSLSFDYYSKSQTVTYTVIAPNVFNVQPSGQVGTQFNFRYEGVASLVGYRQISILSQSRETLGKVDRVSVTARRVFEQQPLTNAILSGGETNFNGLAFNAVPNTNPWKATSIAGL